MAKAFKITDYLEPSAEPRPMEITLVKISKIDANWKNFYSVDFLEQDLAESIKVSGLLTPLGVVEGVNGRYKLISGHRRLRALRYLYESEREDRARWELVPCVVYDTPEDADREELMLIHANAQRVKSGPELQKEAAKTTEILTRMKERGVELPGRMRERVAEALQISSTRLARLEAIKNNLTYPGWQRKWEEQKINESVAYRLSQCSYDEQMNAADWVIDHHIEDKAITVRHIEETLAHPPLTKPGCADPLAYETDVSKVDRELVRRAQLAGYFSAARFANRKDGMDQLKLTFRHAGHGEDGLDWDGEPTGIRFKKPIEWHIGWGAIYDALAANALDAAFEANNRPAPVKADAEAVKAPPPDPAQAPQVAVSDRTWRSCVNDPPTGWTLAFLLTVWDGRYSYDIQLAQYHDGKWWGVYDESENDIEIDGDDWWTPATAIPAEAWE
ncbi:MAG: ParB N-terminal domain-containing protein [Oscillospiraceae bacterium]|nr:ParB N-terminal domain-containing protein [Oscillospiraceae bacterium]